MNCIPLTGLFLVAVLAQAAFGQSIAERGQFWRIHWYERGLEHANPAFEARFRVNSPEVVMHPVFGQRIEARENGLMLIRAEEDLSQITGVELYLEMWGGHPGTANKRVPINGRSTYSLPRVGTEEMNCTYHYPTVPLAIRDTGAPFIQRRYQPSLCYQVKHRFSVRGGIELLFAASCLEGNTLLGAYDPAPCPGPWPAIDVIIEIVQHLAKLQGGLGCGPQTQVARR